MSFGDMPCDGICNPADPNASYNAHRGLGYIAQIVETYAEDDYLPPTTVPRSPDLITHVTVHKMTVHDGHQLPAALDELADRALTPEVLLADSHYSSGENMAQAHKRGINLAAPAQTAKGHRSGCLALKDFHLNERGQVVAYPNGVAPASTSIAPAKLQARFDLATCRACPEKARYPAQVGKHEEAFARLQYTSERAKNRKRLPARQRCFSRNLSLAGGHRSNNGALEIPDETCTFEGQGHARH